jgi:hypothetical protein
MDYLAVICRSVRYVYFPKLNGGFYRIDAPRLIRYFITMSLFKSLLSLSAALRFVICLPVVVLLWLAVCWAVR